MVVVLVADTVVVVLEAVMVDVVVVVSDVAVADTLLVVVVQLVQHLLVTNEPCVPCVQNPLLPRYLHDNGWPLSSPNPV